MQNSRSRIFGCFITGVLAGITPLAHGENNGKTTSVKAEDSEVASENHGDLADDVKQEWPVLKQQLLDLHNNAELKQLAKSQDVDVVLAKDIYFIGASENRGSVVLYQYVIGSLVFNGDGIKLKSTQARKLYSTPSFAKFISSGAWGKLSNQQKVILAKSMKNRKLIEEIRKTLNSDVAED